MKPNFSTFTPPISNITPNGEIELLDVFKTITSPILAQQTYEVQKFYEDGAYLQKALLNAESINRENDCGKTIEAKKRLLKDICERYHNKFTDLKTTSLPYVTFSVCCEKRKTECIKSFSGLICYDFDKVPDTEKAFITIVKKTFPALAFISPSGAGIKCVYQVDAPQQVDNGEAFKSYFNELYYNKRSELKSELPEELFSCLDPTSCDVMRACFLCNSLFYYIAPAFVC